MMNYFDIKKGVYSALVILTGMIWVNLYGNQYIVFTIMVGLFLFSCFDINAPLLHRVKELIITALLCAVLTPLAILSGNFLPTAIVLTFLVVFASSMALALGPQATKVGFFVTAWIMVALAVPGDAAAALRATLSFLGGGCFYLIYILITRNSKGLTNDTSEMMALQVLENVSAQLKRHLNLKSPIFQFALLRSVATALAVITGWILFDSNSYWVSYAVYFVTKPSPGYSMRPGMERAVGTLIGAVLAYFTVFVFFGNHFMSQSSHKPVEQS